MLLAAKWDDVSFAMVCREVNSVASPKLRRSGSGFEKTVAFAIPTIEKIDATSNKTQALVVCPTRELALQVAAEIKKLLKFKPAINVVAVYGGEPIERQMRQLKKSPHIIVGTPGRVHKHLRSGNIDLGSLRTFVLDEADRMFDLGFIDDIRYLMRRMPAPDKRLNMLFSATLSHRVAELAYEHMNSPEEVEIEPDQKTVDRIRQVVYYTAMTEKIPLLIGLLQQGHLTRTIVFVNTKRVAERIEDYFRSNDIDGAVISGDVPQPKRIKLLERFSTGDLPILVATDVAARGLHIPDVSHVINYDLPTDPEDYVHRIGRTARAGADGDAISFACEDFAYYLPDIEEYVGHKLPNEPVPTELFAEVKPRVRRPRKPSGGKQGNRKHGGKNSGRRGSRNRRRSAS